MIDPFREARAECARNQWNSMKKSAPYKAPEIRRTWFWHMASVWCDYLAAKDILAQEVGVYQALQDNIGKLVWVRFHSSESGARPGPWHVSEPVCDADGVGVLVHGCYTKLDHTDVAIVGPVLVPPSEVPSE